MMSGFNEPVADWQIDHFALTAPNWDASCAFFRDIIGLPLSVDEDANIARIGKTLRLLRQSNEPQQPVYTGACFAVPDLDGVKAKLQISGTAFDVETIDGNQTILVRDPSHNPLRFIESAGATPDVHPWEIDQGFGLHHVNLMCFDVRQSVAFFETVAGIKEGKWVVPDTLGSVSIAPEQLSPLSLGMDERRWPNRGLHLNRPDHDFALRNGFAHNPTVGGHPAIWVRDIQAVISRLRDAEYPFTDAGIYAMVGVHQIYVYDPNGQVIEINQPSSIDL